MAIGKLNGHVTNCHAYPVNVDVSSVGHEREAQFTGKVNTTLTFETSGRDPRWLVNKAMSARGGVFIGVELPDLHSCNEMRKLSHELIYQEDGGVALTDSTGTVMMRGVKFCPYCGNPVDGSEDDDECGDD